MRTWIDHDWRSFVALMLVTTTAGVILGSCGEHETHDPCAPSPVVTMTARAKPNPSVRSGGCPEGSPLASVVPTDAATDGSADEVWE